ncbi:MAG: hypothetical protein U0441_24335 [Polyangiaceae bacterium]
MTMRSFGGPRGPGLAKTRGDRLFQRRAVEMWASVPGPMAAFVRRADVVSEGEVREENDARVYYGSTSLLFVPSPETAALSPAELCARLAADPHARLLALRIAVREATLRAGGDAGSAATEMEFRESAKGVLIHVDMTLPLDAAALRSA